MIVPDLTGIIPSQAKATSLAGVADGFEAFVLASLYHAQPDSSLVYIAQNDASAQTFLQTLNFIIPNVTAAWLPAWDCAPYDRISPHADVMATRIQTLLGLAQDKPAVVVTTINAALQKIPPREGYQQTWFEAKSGARIGRDDLISRLAALGYRRTSQVIEPGDFVVNGGLIDIFASGEDQPIRLDFFGDEIETVRPFDPANQRSSDRQVHVTIRPFSEVALHEEARARFRSGYRQAFGTVGTSDSLYEAISAGHVVPGMEHWLPLFYRKLETLFDYVTKDSIVVLAPQAERLMAERLEYIQDFYEARQQALEVKTDNPYRPLPPSALYLDRTMWAQAITSHRIMSLHTATGIGSDMRTRPGVDFRAARQSPDRDVLVEVATYLREQREAGRHVLLTAASTGGQERLRNLLSGVGTSISLVQSLAELDSVTPGSVVLPLERGFCSDHLIVLTEQDMFGERLTRRKRRRRANADIALLTQSLNAGDLVIHAEHGLARFAGLQTRQVGGTLAECAQLEYADNAKVYVAAVHFDLLSKAGAGTPPALDRLGGMGWQQRRARAKKLIRDMAQALMKTAAARASAQLPPMTYQAETYERFCARFAFPETEDQLAAIDDVMKDLRGPAPMDRLICGDVGFGKTEVALRAAFAVAMTGKQVAVLAPTTLLVRQHVDVFRERFKSFPIKVGALSRLVSDKDKKQVRHGLSEGTIDIVIGTHALLSKATKFHRLGLVIIDEEQRFGVSHKEKFKQLRAQTHVLSLTATPIPRTLQMALSGLRGMSTITTPPVDRLAVRTFVSVFDPLIIKDAIARELFRAGQVYVVCPRITDLDEIQAHLADLNVRMMVAHGQLPSRQLEDIMTKFYEGEIDVLISTSIIESGLDVPNANTLIVYHADRFGLAQLYQIRGRVGRAKRRAYAYFTHVSPRLTTAAHRRLRALESLEQLGSGFQLASQDLDIRGAGNLLGEEQSGQIREVGPELYQHMLEEAIAQLRGETLPNHFSPTIDIGVQAMLPDSYIANVDVRTDLYRRIARALMISEIDELTAEMADRFGALPPDAIIFTELVRLKLVCIGAQVSRLEVGVAGCKISMRPDIAVDPAGLARFLENHQARLRPDQSIFIAHLRREGSADERIRTMRALVSDLAQVIKDDHTQARPPGRPAQNPTEKIEYAS